MYKKLAIRKKWGVANLVIFLIWKEGKEASGRLSN